MASSVTSRLSALERIWLRSRCALETMVPSGRAMRTGAGLAPTPGGSLKVARKSKQIRPLPGVLGGRDLSIGAVDQRVGAIAAQPAFRHLGGVQLLAHHGLDRVSPQRPDRTQLHVRG